MRLTFSHVDHVNLCPEFFECIRDLVGAYASVRELVNIAPFLEACTMEGRLCDRTCGIIAPILREITDRFTSQHEFHRMATLRICDGLEKAARSQESFQFGG